MEQIGFKMFLLSIKNILNKPLSSALSLLLLAIGVAMMSLLFMLNRQMDKQFKKNISGIDMVIGAKGSPLQLILSSIYQIDYPTGNIKLSEVQKWVKSPLVENSIPLSYGDSYQSYRIVGTESAYLDHYEAVIADGVKWSSSMQAVLGAKVAKESGLRIGDTFASQHGLHAESEAHTEHPFTVVGILEPNGTVLDQLILTGLESVWHLHEDHSHDGHSHEGHDHSAHEADREITALLVSFRNPMGMMSIPRRINQESVMQAALPSIEVNRLLGLLSSAIQLLKYLGGLLLLVSGVSVFISLLNSLKERKYELALLRSMGASPAKVFSMVLFESLILTVIGFVLGWLLSRLAFVFVSFVLEGRYHYDLAADLFSKEELMLGLLCIVLGVAAAMIPALSAYRLNISKTLANA